MAELEELILWDGEFLTDAGVLHLAGLKNLKEIAMHHSNLTDDSLVLLSGCRGWRP